MGNVFPLQKDEIELLRQINRGLSEMIQTRFAELRLKRELGTLTSAEYNELLDIVEQIEQHDLERIQALIEMAKSRDVSVRTLMEQLDLIANDDAEPESDQY